MQFSVNTPEQVRSYLQHDSTVHAKFLEKNQTINNKTKIDSAIALLIFFSSIIATSPIFGSLINIKGNQFSIIAIILSLSFINIINNFAFTFFWSEILIIIITVSLALINSMYWSAQTSLSVIYFLLALILSNRCSKKHLHSYVDLLTIFHFILLIGAIIGFLYTLTGGNALFFIKNPDNRENGFYLSTFSNSYFTNFIRPSGLYDEPGALSFFTCLTVAFREHFKMPRITSTWLLILGLITGSLAHLIFFIIYLFSFIRKFNAKKVIKALIFSTCIIFISLPIFFNEIDKLLEFYIDRLSFDNGELSGDSRSILTMNAWNYLETNTFLWGLDGNCIAQNPSCNQNAYLKYGENPLSILVHYGIFLALPYYALIATLLFKSIKERKIIIFGIFLLLLQRPNVMSFGYSVAIMLYLNVILRKKFS